MKMYISEKKNYKKCQKSRKFNEEDFWTTGKSYQFQEKIALPVVLQKIVGMALISVEDLRQS